MTRSDPSPQGAPESVAHEAESLSLSLIAKNTVANLVQPGVSWLVVLFLPPLLVRVLDRPTYATWMLLLQITAYVSIVDMSFTGVTIHFMGRARGLRDDKYLLQRLESIFVLLVLVGAVAIVAIVFAYWTFAGIFHEIPRAIAFDARNALALLGISLALTLPLSIYAGTFMGRQKNEVVAASAISGKVVMALGVAWAAFNHQGLVAMAAWAAAGNIVSKLFCFCAWKILHNPPVVRFYRVSREALREVGAFWSAMLVVQLCGILVTGLDLPIVAAFTFKSAAFYAIAATVSNILIVPQSAVFSALLPVTSQLGARSTPEQMGEMVVNLTRFNVALQLALAVPILFGMPAFLHLWVGAEYARRSLPYAVVLVVAQCLRFTLGSYALVGFSAGQQHKMLASPIAEGVSNVIASLILVQFMGAMGVAVGTLLGAAVAVAVHLTVSVRKTSAVRLNRSLLFRSGILRPLACAAPAIVFMGAVDWLTPNRAVRWPLLLVGVCLMVSSLFLGNFNRNEREQALQVARGWFRAILHLMPWSESTP